MLGRQNDSGTTYHALRNWQESEFCFCEMLKYSSDGRFQEDSGVTLLAGARG